VLMMLMFNVGSTMFDWFLGLFGRTLNYFDGVFVGLEETAASSSRDVSSYWNRIKCAASTMKSSLLQETPAGTGALNPSQRGDVSVKANLFKNALKLLSYNTFIPLVYDPLMYLIKKDRQRAMDAMEFEQTDTVFIPGVGMGNDLPYLANRVGHITGIDVSDVMLSGASLRAKNLGVTNVDLKVMDAELLQYPDGHFDKAVLTLFLTVAFDPKKVFSEVVRVLKPGGEILVFDHFVKQGALPSPLLKTLDTFMKVTFTSIARVFEEIIEGQQVTIVKELSPKTPGFKIYVLKKDVVDPAKL